MPSPHPRPRPLLRLLLAAGLIGVTAVAVWEVVRFVRGPGPANDPAAEAREADPRSPLDPDEAEAVRVFKATRDSVVNVDTVALVRGLDMAVQQQQTGTGSGFVWDDAGRVVTNFHVVREAVARGLALRVVLADRTEWDARVVGVAPEADLAVVQVTGAGAKLPKIKVGRSADLEVGQKVYAIGNPFGLSLSMTKGIISALDREIESVGGTPIAGAIQTDAAINPGNSGGPLLDKDGRLIGVNTSIASPSGGNVGIGFAIPVDTVNAVVPELVRRGRVLKPDLGVRLVEERRARRAGFPRGVMVEQVLPLGPAAKAGLRGVRSDPRTGEVEPGDVIVAVDGEAVGSAADLARAVARRKVGDAVKLRVERAGGTTEIELVLAGV